MVPFTWLFLQWIAIGVFAYASQPHPIMTLTTSLLSAWIFIRFATHMMTSDGWSNVIAISAWSVAALNIVGLLDHTLEVLDMVALTVGTIRISLLTFVKGAVILAALLWIAIGLASVAERSMRKMEDVSPVARVLMIKLLRVVLIIVAILIALNSLGIDLTALAVFSGALGVGLGFGLQKIFSNLVSGVILLMDKSIKPGDVIAIKDTFGWINHLGARYASVITRDGTEHLIPNEEMITQQVENWSHSHSLVRLRIPLEVEYASDPRQVIALCEESALMVPRVLIDPPPKCQLRGFGENGLTMELRIWINDPQQGRANVITEVLLQVWDRFQEHDIKVPYPQREVRLLNTPEQQAVL